jgi:acyl dehydratase
MDKNSLGKVGRPVTMPVERGKIREFAKAIKDDNPVYFDEDYATATLGGIMPPPTFFMTLSHWDDTGEGRPDLQADIRYVLHGEQEFEYLKPVYAGDVLTAITRVKDIFEKPGRRGGTMAFGVMETEFRNQRGELCVIARATLIETGQVVRD